MIARATTTVSVLGGTGTDPFGDTTDGSTVLLAGQMASLIESQRTAREPSSDVPRIVRTHVARMTAGTPVTEDNRLRDERTGAVYIVVSVSLNSNPQSAQDIRLDLKRTGPAG